MRVLPDRVQFNPVCQSKQSHPSRPIKPFIFPSFSPDKRLCPKVTVQAYVARTESFRSEGLLLFFVKPCNPISSSSLARWIVSITSTDTFKSHLVRSASATAAASAGITTNQIMEATDWRSESVFERFYYKPDNSNQVGQAVLSTSSADSLRTSYSVRVICDPSFQNVITWMAQITHAVIASYSGLHEECEVNISTSHPSHTWSMSCIHLIASITPFSDSD